MLDNLLYIVKSLQRTVACFSPSVIWLSDALTEMDTSMAYYYQSGARFDRVNSPPSSINT